MLNAGMPDRTVLGSGLLIEAVAITRDARRCWDSVMPEKWKVGKSDCRRRGETPPRSGRWIFGPVDLYFFAENGLPSRPHGERCIGVQFRPFSVQYVFEHEAKVVKGVFRSGSICASLVESPKES